ncbi:purine phosphoribosyltransferase (adenine phosphoribosyltransferase, xanthine-guanine phosphoribosyltransferase) [Natrialba magadii ATCC 43099]|uniref:Adenine phosphoribosyltransferase n=1 Tax=Natrialba magadii (strain ATCC 43099 / DSM 3394 / CCM 3739 / CIP 104546 / IAM 13178 / JCM 8861 / NBRC 102185 / NCIMB 2190 / MS3) TaxID=547559 RepID=D3SQQ4_NATMM|nr:MULTISPECIES: phosphoribosyltransferase family protein [Natrialba]ADD04542.1 purine phosphoribosyltransferase (adenine phosphoribosyltransferase, xanthine-guanine phosphoribosyltransferase) [Natrialba magadii ATCC 43099]ELY25199.1 adenine phosphoribosyltransferase [Natrialba magadii ATCC 43099]OIB55979.1 adenine phosphoribosyltransferase [Natrialba sp. SSL1]
MNRAEKAALQLRAVDVLRMLKETRTYDELAETTGLPAGDLNRYVNGHVLPGTERAREVVDDIGREAIADELNARIRVDDEGYVDNSGTVFDQSFLDLVAPVVANGFEFDRPDVVLTAATDGITLAASLASYYGTRCAYAKKSKETAVEEFIEARQRLQSGIELTYYLPASAVDAGDSVLVVDDLIRSGETQELLLDIVETSEAEVAGVFALIAAGDDGIERARERTDAPVGALTTV